MGERYFRKIAKYPEIPTGTIMALAQDNRGFIWMGSQKGLIRFDGYDFVTYQNERNNPYSLADNYVKAITPTPNGKIWVGTRAKGISVYDPKADAFTHFTDENGLWHNNIWSIVADALGNLWVSTPKGVSYFSVEKNKLFKLNITNCPTTTSYLTSLMLTRDGTLWVGSNDGLCQINRPYPESDKLSISGNWIEDFSGSLVRQLLQGTGQTIWVSLQKEGLAKYDVSTGEMELLSFVNSKIGNHGNNNIFSLLNVNNEQIWAGSYGGGIYVVDAATNKLLSNIRHDPAIDSSLSLDELGSLLMDKNGLIWIGTWGEGVDVYNPQNDSIRNIRHHTNQKSLISHENVRVVHGMKNGEVWVGNRKTGIDVLLPKQNNSILHSPNSDEPNTLKSGYIKTIIESDSGEVWIGSRHTGLYYFDRDSNHFIQFTEKDGLNYSGVSTLLSHKQNLWVGTTSGLNLFNLEQKEFIDLSFIENKQLLEGKHVRKMVIKDDSEIWIGTYMGLYVFNLHENKITEISEKANTTKTLSSNQIGDLGLDNKGMLWVSTVNGLDRLIRWDGSIATFDSVNQRADLINQSAGLINSSNLFFDDTNRLWNGMGVLNTEEWRFYPLSEYEGWNNVWGNSGGKASDGTILFGGSSGVFMVNPNKWQPSKVKPKAIFTSIDFDNETTYKHINLLELKPNTNLVSIQFAADDFSAPPLLNYAFKLEGYDDDWNYTDSKNRRATYTKLPPGSYELKVKVQGRWGDWNEDYTTLTVTQLAAWYETLWFKLTVSLIIVSLLREAYKFRVKQLKRNSELLEMKVEERTKQLAESQKTLIQQEKMAGLGTLTAGVMHEINNPTNFTHASLYSLREKHDDLFTFLYELAGGDKADIEVLKLFEEKRKELASITDTAEEGTKRIKQIVADLSHFARVDKGDKKQNDIKALLESSINLIRTKYPDITFDTEKLDSVNIVCYPSKLSQVFLNLLVNSCQAIKQRYSESEPHDGKITLSTNIEGEKLILSISDNGCGMDEETLNKVFEPFFTTKEVGAGTGLGMSISYSIIEEHGGRMEVESTLHKGTTIRIILHLNSH